MLFRLALTLDDLEHSNRGFIIFFAILGCDTYFKSELRQNLYT